MILEFCFMRSVSGSSATCAYVKLEKFVCFRTIHKITDSGISFSTNSWYKNIFERSRSVQCVWTLWSKKKLLINYRPGRVDTYLCQFAFLLLKIGMIFYIRLDFRIFCYSLQFWRICDSCCLGFWNMAKYGKISEKIITRINWVPEMTRCDISVF